MEATGVIKRAKAPHPEKDIRNVALHALVAVVALGMLTALWVSLWVPSVPIP